VAPQRHSVVLRQVRPEGWRGSLRCGFTLIELLVVAAIIALLAALLLQRCGRRGHGAGDGLPEQPAPARPGLGALPGRLERVGAARAPTVALLRTSPTTFGFGREIAAYTGEKIFNCPTARFQARATTSTNGDSA